MPDEFASPSGCDAFADRRRSAAEFTAPHDTTNRSAVTRTISPLRSTSTASTFDPDVVVVSRSARAFVQSVTFDRRSAGRTQHTSASLFAWRLQTNELHVLHRM